MVVSRMCQPASSCQIAKRALAPDLPLLIRIGDAEPLQAALKDPSAQVRRAALIALDQMDNGNLKPEMVTPLLDPIDLPLQQAALKVITSHSGWSNEIFGLVREWLSAATLDAERSELLKGVLVSFSRDSAMQDLMAQTLREDKTSPAMRLLVLEAMARAQGGCLLGDVDRETQLLGLASVGSIQLASKLVSEVSGRG
jgi:hypothetical protein